MSIVERGNGWEMHLGDCLDVMATLEKVDHVITDPPYSQRTSDGARTGSRPSNAHNIIDFDGLTDDFIARLVPAMLRLSSRWVVCFCAVEQIGTYERTAGDTWIRTGAWVKPDATPQFTGDRPAMGFEACAILHRAGRKRWNGGGRPALWTHGFERLRNGHPTPKPLTLMQELVTLFTDPDETVLDAFAGSGTTGVACIRLGRRFIGIEKDPNYFELACERLRAEESGSTLQAARAGQLPLLGGVK